MVYKQILLLLAFSSLLSGQIATFYSVRGYAIDSTGILLENKVAVLMDASNKILYRTRTTKKFIKRYGGGKFEFNKVQPGEYTLQIETGAQLKIIRKINLTEENIDLGTLHPRREIPTYTLPDFPDSLVILMRPITTDLIVSDTVNIRHILIQLNGEALVGRVDSLNADSLYYQNFENDSTVRILLNRLYLVYNDYGKLIYKSRSFDARMLELEKRDGIIVTHAKDTVYYDRLIFERSMNKPTLAVYMESDSIPHFYNLLDVYMIRTGEGYIENSVRRGFWTGIWGISGYIALRMLFEKSFKPVLSIIPDPILTPTGNQYQSITLALPLITIGWVAYDFYLDKRSNYFIPHNLNDPFPNNMYVFSITYWLVEKIKPVIDPVINSKIVKYFKDRKKKKRK